MFTRKFLLITLGYVPGGSFERTCVSVRYHSDNSGLPARDERSPGEDSRTALSIGERGNRVYVRTLGIYSVRGTSIANRPTSRRMLPYRLKESHARLTRTTSRAYLRSSSNDRQHSPQLAPKQSSLSAQTQANRLGFPPVTIPVASL